VYNYKYIEEVKKLGKYFNKEIFAERLITLMEQNNDTTYSLGEYLHLSPPTISRYCTADMSPKTTTVEIIAIKYGVNPAWLMGTDGQPKYLDGDLIPKKIPILGVIAAGQPILALENIIGYEFVPSNVKVDFCLKVKGDSMINAKINDGDIVFIRQQPDVENGEIAAVIIDGEEATLKRIYKYPGAIALRPENSNYSEQVFDKKSFKSITIIGKCITVKFTLE
jgi:repressor LexA